MGREELNLLELTADGEATLRSVARIKQSGQPVRQTVVSLTTIAEMHVANVLRTLVESEKAGRTALDEALLKRFETQMFQSWSALFEWMKTGFNVALPANQASQQFDDCVELRNAIVHGNMTLTSLQDKDLVKSLKLRRRMERSLKVTFDGPTIVVGPQTLEQTFQIVRGFVMLFDKTVLATHKNVVWNLGDNGAGLNKPRGDVF